MSESNRSNKILITEIENKLAAAHESLLLLLDEIEFYERFLAIFEKQES